MTKRFKHLGRTCRVAMVVGLVVCGAWLQVAAAQRQASPPPLTCTAGIRTTLSQTEGPYYKADSGVPPRSADPLRPRTGWRIEPCLGERN